MGGGYSASPLEFTAASYQRNTNNAEDTDASVKRDRVKLGQCETCGNRTYKVSGLLVKTRTALTIPGLALNGRCLRCFPLKGGVAPHTLSFSAVAKIHNARWEGHITGSTPEEAAEEAHKRGAKGFFESNPKQFHFIFNGDRTFDVRTEGGYCVINLYSTE
jgi:hypothetical protein